MATQNATALPDLDMSTSVPVSPAPAAQSSALPDLDMSTSVPVTAGTSAAPSGVAKFAGDVAAGLGPGSSVPGGPAETSALQTLWSHRPGGPGETLALKTIWDNLPPVQLVDSVKQVLPLIHSYETARANGSSMSDALTAVNETAKQHISNISPIKPLVDAFRANPTKETVQALTHGVALAASMFTGGAPEAEAATAAPEAKAVTLPPNPFKATSKIEPAVTARTAKASLAPGEPGLTTDAASAQTAQSALDAQAATQKNIDTTLQDIAGQHAKANGITAPAPGTATRDILTTNGDALVEAGKANYKILDKYTDGKFTNAQQELKNAQLELRSKAGMTDVDTGDLEANVTRAQWNADQLFDNAVKNGMPKATADAARSQFRTGQATLDAGNAVRMANRVSGTAGLRTTNLNTLENRWTALSDSGRLQQAFGEQGAKDALTQIHAAREAGEVFASMPPTESQALSELISKNTVTDKFGTRTAWRKVRSDFSSLPDRGARFSDVPKVEKFLNNQVFYQTLRQGALGVAGTALGGAAFRLGESAIPLP